MGRLAAAGKAPPARRSHRLDSCPDLHLLPEGLRGRGEHHSDWATAAPKLCCSWTALLRAESDRWWCWLC